eukprot:4529331-Alexandrium_andersonii.AAC.1
MGSGDRNLKCMSPEKTSKLNPEALGWCVLRGCSRRRGICRREGLPGTPGEPPLPREDADPHAPVLRGY